MTTSREIKLFFFFSLLHVVQLSGLAGAGFEDCAEHILEVWESDVVIQQLRHLRKWLNNIKTKTKPSLVTFSSLKCSTSWASFSISAVTASRCFWRELLSRRVVVVIYISIWPGGYLWIWWETHIWTSCCQCSPTSRTSCPPRTPGNLRRLSSGPRTLSADLCLPAGLSTVQSNRELLSVSWETLHCVAQFSSLPPQLWGVSPSQNCWTWPTEEVLMIYSK